MLRSEIFRFLRVWNTHTIRKQNNRPNAVPGKPFVLYNAPGPGVQDFSVPIDLDLLQTMKDRSENWDMDTFLPEETYEWCQDFFTSINFNPVIASSSEQFDLFHPFHQVYLQLRTALQAYINSEQAPRLSLIPSPTGAAFNVDWNSIVSLDLETDHDN